MVELLILPQQRAATRWQQRYPDGTLLPFSLPGWVSELLKFQGTAYRENKTLEVLAVHQGLWQARQQGELRYFEPLADFAGLAQDLHWLYQQLGLGAVAITEMPREAQAEVGQLYQAYLEQLQGWQVLDGGSQAQAALNVVDAWCAAKDITSVRTVGLFNVPQGYQELIQRAANGRGLEEEVAPATGSVKVVAGASPTAEVEAIAMQVQELLTKDVAPNQIAVVLADPGGYMPLVQQVFQRLHLPWQPPAPSLAAVPVGKAVTALLDAVSAEITKQHWQRLAAPGWGWPWELDGSSLRLLRLAPAVKGLPRWRGYLGGDERWPAYMEQVATWSAAADRCTTVQDYALWLRDVMSQYLPDTWYSPNEENWAQLLQAWDLLHGILDGLEASLQTADWMQFRHLFGLLLNSQRLGTRREFRQTMLVGSLEQVLGMEYDYIFAIGLNEGTFPRRQSLHWLAGTGPDSMDEQLWQHLKGAAAQLVVSYPLADRDGRSQLPSPLLDGHMGSKVRLEPGYSNKIHPGVIGTGVLTDPQVVAAIRSQLLQRPQSVSRLNSYLACPYQYYCQQVLHLEEDAEISEDLTPLAEGTAVHSILQRFWQAFASGPLPSVSDAQQWVSTAAKDEEVRLGKPLSQQLLRRLMQFIRWDLETLPEQYRPRLLEETFQELSIDVDGVPIKLQGKIDRVDVNPQDNTCVILDYKTGRNPQAREIRDGVHLQLPVYFLATRALWPQLTPVGTSFYSIRERKKAGLWQKPYNTIFGIGGSSNTLDAEVWQATTDAFTEHLQNCLRGILAGRFPIEPRSTTICGYCPYNGVCRKEVR